jgi:FecR-like protein
VTPLWRMPGVAPLSRVAWQRVESRVFASLDRRERSGAFPAFRPTARRLPHRALIGALAVAASAPLVWLTLAKPPTAEAPAAMPGAAAVATRAPVGIPGALPAYDGSRIATTTGPVEVAVGDSVLGIHAQSVVQVNGDDRSGWQIQLHRGEIHCHVAPRGQRAPFVVRAADTTVTVVGTRFEVALADGQARVSVEEGLVRVERQGSAVVLHAGETWPPAQLASSRADTETHSSLESRPATPPLERSAPHARASSQLLFERATRLEPRDPKGALDFYRRVGPRGPWAANALYGRARLELELGNRAGARRELELYMRRYPHGANAADVRALLERVGAERPERP